MCLFVLYSQNYAARALPILFNTPKKSLLKSSYLSQIFIPKKILESKISNSKKSFDHPRHLKSRVPPLGSAIVTDFADTCIQLLEVSFCCLPSISPECVLVHMGS